MLTRKIAVGALAGALAAGLSMAPATAHENSRRGGWQSAEGGTVLMLTRGVKQELRRDGITVSAVSPARQWNPVLFTFPVVGSVNGTVTHGGGITLTKGAASVVLSGLVVDTSDGTVDATVDGAPLTDVFTLTHVRSGGKWLKADLRLGNHASHLNSELDTSVFADGMFLGKVASWSAWPKAERTWKQRDARDWFRAKGWPHGRR